MASEYICDGCGKRQMAAKYPNGHQWEKPRDWFQRSDKDGIQDACSRKCVDVIAEKTKKTNVIMPI